jgi:hypothetical protein
MNFFDTITIATVGLTTIAVVFILLTNLFEITKDTLSRMSIDDIATPETEAIQDDDDDESIPDNDDDKAIQDNDDDKAIQDDDDNAIQDNDDDDESISYDVSTQTDDANLPPIVNAPPIVDAPPIVETQKDPNTWYDSDDALTRYKGEWKNGLPNGKGIKEFFGSRHPCVIEGTFVDGFANGHCIQRFEKTWEKTAPYYVGEFSQNQWHGFGEYHYGDYTYYKGEWRNGQSNGQGMEYSIILNQTWVGTFCNDKRGIGKWVDGRL